MSDEIVIYGKKSGCSGCVQMKFMLEIRGYKNYTFIDVTQDSEALSMLKDKGIQEVPQLVWDGEWIGGLRDFQLRVNELCGEN